jgi:hypothetical protein
MTVWWLGGDGSHLEAVLRDADAAVRNKAPRAARGFTDPQSAARHFRGWRRTGRLPGSPFNIGRQGSQSHMELLQRIASMKDWVNSTSAASKSCRCLARTE